MSIVLSNTKENKMNKHIIYLKQGKVCKYRTAKSYIKYKARLYASTKFNGFLAYIDHETHKGLKITTNA